MLLLLVLGTQLLLLPVHTLVYLTATAYLFIIPIVFDETRHPRTRKVFSADWIQCIPSSHSNPSQLPSLSVVTTSSSLTIKYKACHWTGTGECQSKYLPSSKRCFLCLLSIHSLR